MKTLYLEQVGGVSGDMFLGALVSLGLDVGELEAGLARLGIPGLSLEARSVERHGLSAVQVSVLADEIPKQKESPEDAGGGHHHAAHDHPHAHPAGGPRRDPPAPVRGVPQREQHHHHSHRPCSAIIELIRAAGLPAPVADRAVAVFTRLGEAEAAEHGVPLDAVVFHEVGAVDSIADIVGVCFGLHRLGVERIVSSPFLFGRGRVEMAHGFWPVPAPATVRLTRGHPVQFTELEGETVTPTGAALIVTLADAIGEFPAMTLLRSGSGAGSRDWPDRPNVLRAFLGDAIGRDVATDEVLVLSTVIDDSTPEIVGRLPETLMGLGALDVVLQPVIMKKGRPGIRVEVLSPVDSGSRIADGLFRETSTIGIRWRREGRWILNRRFGRVDLPWGAVNVKVVKLPDGRERVTPEFEDCLRLSALSGMPVADILAAAAAAPVSEVTEA